MKTRAAIFVGTLMLAISLGANAQVEPGASGVIALEAVE